MALNELRVHPEYRLDALDAKCEGLLTIVESGDDIAVVRALCDYDDEDGQMVLDLRNILGWHDGTYGLQRMANAMRFGLGLTKPQIMNAWNAADAMEARTIDATLKDTKS